MRDFSFLKDIGRRDFLKIISIAGAGGLIYPQHLLPEATENESRVVIVTDKNATEGKIINTKVIKLMFEEGLKLLGGFNNIADSWKYLLQGIDNTKVTGIKVNCFNNKLSSHPQFVYEVVESMSAMQFGNKYYNKNNIIIFDKSNNDLHSANYNINTTATGVRCFGTDEEGVGYSEKSYDVNGSMQSISKIAEAYSDYLINMAVLKNHELSGVSLCMKNNYGTCNKPDIMHDNYCDPYIAALNSIHPLKQKQKLFIIDALFGLASEGPGGIPNITPNSIIMGNDIVAVDYYGAKMLRDFGCLTTENAHYINTASMNYGLGTNNPDKITLKTIHNPSEPIAVEENTEFIFNLHQNYPNPFSGITQIRFELFTEANISIDIYGIDGNHVISLVNTHYSYGNYDIAWNGKTSSGVDLPNGLYVCKLSLGNKHKSIIIRKIK